jgi:flavodoxin
MSKLIVYYSRTGTTKRVAEALALTLEGDKRHGR